MRTADFSRILFESTQLCGLDRDEINDATFGQIRDLASIRLRHAWEYDAFPQVIKFQELTIVTNNDTPAVVIPSDCGEILNMWVKNPLNTTRNEQVTFLLNQSYAYLTKSLGGTLWAEYKVKAPNLFGNAWKVSTTYEIGSQCYFDTGSGSGAYKPSEGKLYAGNFYECIKSNVNRRPNEHLDEWKIIEIPHVFVPYVTRAVFADYLRSEGQMDSARIAEAEAQSFMDEEIDKIARQQSQIRRINFINPYI
jgi:hypothetical protein